MICEMDFHMLGLVLGLKLCYSSFAGLLARLVQMAIIVHVHNLHSFTFLYFCPFLCSVQGPVSYTLLLLVAMGMAGR